MATNNTYDVKYAFYNKEGKQPVRYNTKVTLNNTLTLTDAVNQLKLILDNLNDNNKYKINVTSFNKMITVNITNVNATDDEYSKFIHDTMYSYPVTEQDELKEYLWVGPQDEFDASELINYTNHYHYVVKHVDNAGIMSLHLFNTPYSIDLRVSELPDNVVISVKSELYANGEEVVPRTTITFRIHNDPEYLAYDEVVNKVSTIINTMDNIFNPKSVNQDLTESGKSDLDEDVLLNVNQLYRFKQTDTHALRVFEHSVLQRRLPYALIRYETSEVADIYVYIGKTIPKIMKTLRDETKYDFSTVFVTDTTGSQHVQGYATTITKVGNIELQSFLRRIVSGV